MINASKVGSRRNNLLHAYPRILAFFYLIALKILAASARVKPLCGL